MRDAQCVELELLSLLSPKGGYVFFWICPFVCACLSVRLYFLSKSYMIFDDLRKKDHAQ